MKCQEAVNWVVNYTDNTWQQFAHSSMWTAWLYIRSTTLSYQNLQWHGWKSVAVIESWLAIKLWDCIWGQIYGNASYSLWASIAPLQLLMNKKSLHVLQHIREGSWHGDSAIISIICSHSMFFFNIMWCVFPMLVVVVVYDTACAYNIQ